MRKLLCFWILAATSCWSAGWDDLEFVLASSLPRELAEYLRTSTGHEAYALAAWLNPYYLQADFDGDGQADIAVLAQEKSTGRRGILIVHLGAGRHFVIGAGHPIGNGGDDFSWMDAWQVDPRGPVSQGADEATTPPALRGDALLVIKTEAASGLIYWTGSVYDWYQQGD